MCECVFFISMNICLSATTTPNSPLATYTQHCSSCFFVCFSNMAMSYRGWSQRVRTIDFFLFLERFVVVVTQETVLQKTWFWFCFLWLEIFCSGRCGELPAERSPMSDSLAILAHGRTPSLAWWLSLYHSVGNFCTNTWTRNLAWSRLLLFWTVCFQLDFCLNYSFFRLFLPLISGLFVLRLSVKQKSRVCFYSSCFRYSVFIICSTWS